MDLEQGIGKIVYGLKKISPSTVETEDGKLIQKPSAFLSDCRACALLNVVCEELESPCAFLREKCGKPDDDGDCEGCEQLQECLGEKPCCWECPLLHECLDVAMEWGADQFVKDIHGCDWEEFLIAVEMLAGRKHIANP